MFVQDVWPGYALRALALSVGAEPEVGEVEKLGELALRCPVPGIGIQTLGLLARAAGSVSAAWVDGAPRLVEDIPRRFRSQRMDILSAAEALASLGALEGSE